MQKKFTKIIVISVVVAVLLTIIVLLAITVLPWATIGIGSLLTPSPPKPEIAYGEFPFKLTYELNGEIKIIEDIIVCEFDGFKSLGEAGKYRKWKQYIKSTGNEYIQLLKVSDDLELFYSPESAEHYMGDPKYSNDSVVYNAQPKTEFKSIEYAKTNDDGTITYSAFLTDEAYSQYRLRMIDWDPSEPIQNSFK